MKISVFLSHNSVATAQGKQGIGMLTFPDRENTGNLVNLIFYTGKILLYKWQQGDGAFCSCHRKLSL